MADTIAGLAADIRKAARGSERYLLGIAGPPCSGKTTLAARLTAALPDARALPMDGFHLDDSVLQRHGSSARKGAPHTFDVAGFAAMLVRARNEPGFYAPSFDRDLEISRAGAIEVAKEDRILIVEGNYLLLDTPGWRDLKPLFDQIWYLEVEMRELTRRMRARWKSYGKSDEDAARWIAGNDLPNAALAQATRGRADRIVTPEQHRLGKVLRTDR